MKREQSLLLAALVIATSGAPVGFKAVQLREMPHEGAPWTQGLELVDRNKLLETGGAYPPGTPSFVRMLDVRTGEVLQTSHEGLQDRFAEGVARTESGWMVTTYHDHKAILYSKDLEAKSEVAYPWEEGWGLARSSSGDRFFATNGSVYMMELNAETLLSERAEPVTCFGHQVRGVNELELVEDFAGTGPTLFGNLLPTRLVLGIDPVTFECKSVFDLTGFGEHDIREPAGFHVANGIAYLPDSGNLIVTGKNWKKMFEISLEEEGTDSAAVEKLRNYLLEPARHMTLLQFPSAPQIAPGVMRKERGGKTLVLARGELSPFGTAA